MGEKNAGSAGQAATGRERNGEIIIGQGVRFERIRRITGYLVGNLDRFNNAKKAEVHDRVKHTGKI